MTVLLKTTMVAHKVISLNAEASEYIRTGEYISLKEKQRMAMEVFLLEEMLLFS